jgi:membrane protease YdiL (CAAX protease family)
MEGTVYEPPPAPPELPEGVDPLPRWPWWYALAGFAVFIFGTFVAQGVLFLVISPDARDSADLDPVVAVVGTLIMECIAIATAWLFASMTAPPKLWHFGIRPTALKPALGWAAAGMGCFYAFSIVYSLVPIDIKQEVTETLGADRGTLGLIVAGIVIVAIAPVAEEIFFRGFIYRSLRGNLGVLPAGIVAGLTFGLVHYQACSSTDSGCNATDGLLLIPPLAVLGLIFCLVYERTGSLFPTIAMHAFNNMIAFGVQAHGWAVALVVGPLVITACVVVPSRLAARRRPLVA